MSTMLIQSGTLDDIADAIRSKTGKVASMTPLEMPQEIASISGGGEVVVDEIIPRMTSNTTPKGTCSASYVYSGRYAYYGFTTSGNGNVSNATQFWYNGGGTDQWIQYEFEKAVTIFHILFGTVENGTGKRFKFQFSSDGTNWTDGETITIADNSYTTYDLSTPVYCKYLRIYCIDNITVISGIRAIGIVGQYNPSGGIAYKTYAKLDIEGIVLDIAQNTDYKITCEFYDTKLSNTVTSVLGLTGSTSVSTISLAIKDANNYGIGTGKGSGSNATISGRSLGDHTIVINDGSNQSVLDGTITTAFTPTTLSGRTYTVGCHSNTMNLVWQGYIKSYKLESLTNGNKICELKPALISVSGIDIPCMIDIINNKVYAPTGLTVMDTIPT